MSTTEQSSTLGEAESRVTTAPQKVSVISLMAKLGNGSLTEQEIPLLVGFLKGQATLELIKAEFRTSKETSALFVKSTAVPETIKERHRKNIATLTIILAKLEEK